MAWQVRTFRLRFWLQLFGLILLLPSLAFSFYLVVSDFQNSPRRSKGLSRFSSRALRMVY